MGRFLFIMGLRMLATLVGWWLYELTRDPLAMGMIGLAEVIPAVSLALYAGHIIDRSDRRKVLLNGVMLYWLAALALLIISTQLFHSHYGKGIVITLIYFVIFCTGAIRSLPALLLARSFLKSFREKNFRTQQPGTRAPG